MEAIIAAAGQGMRSETVDFVPSWARMRTAADGRSAAINGL
jgi:hypothetical protein